MIEKRVPSNKETLVRQTEMSIQLQATIFSGGGSRKNDEEEEEVQSDDKSGKGTKK